MVSKWLVSALAGAAMFAWAATAVLAAPSFTPSAEPMLQGTVTPKSPSPGTLKLAEAIGQRFGMSADQVLALRDRAKGWGQAFMVFALASKTGKSPNEILSLHEAGAGWGKIVRDLGLKAGLKKDNLGAAVSGGGNSNSAQPDERGQPEDRGKGKGDAPGKPAKPGDKGQGKGNSNLWRR